MAQRAIAARLAQADRQAVERLLALAFDFLGRVRRVAHDVGDDGEGFATRGRRGSRARRWNCRRRHPPSSDAPSDSIWRAISVALRVVVPLVSTSAASEAMPARPAGSLLEPDSDAQFGADQRQVALRRDDHAQAVRQSAFGRRRQFGGDRGAGRRRPWRASLQARACRSGSRLAGCRAFALGWSRPSRSCRPSRPSASSRRRDSGS